MDDVLRTFCAELLEMNNVPSHTNYLGLLLVVGKNKEEAFVVLEDKMEKKVTDWKNLIYSWKRKETMITSGGESKKDGLFEIICICFLWL